MIPAAFITEWQAQVAWPERYQVEQDLVLSRLMVEIAADELLGGELVMRGGTCLHKLHLPSAHRYSEDLDYVRRTTGPVGRYLDALRAIVERVGLEVADIDRGGQMVRMVLDADATGSRQRIRIKIETNISETKSFKPTMGIEHVVSSHWWRGSAVVSTFMLDEMMATKLRALYQRRKGRDLFDLWIVLSTQETTPTTIVDGLRHYMADAVFTYPQLRLNLLDKLADAGFRADLEGLLVDSLDGYDIDVAADIVMARLGALLHNAPPLRQIADGAWRSKR